jgi:hypothetical protein
VHAVSGARGRTLPENSGKGLRELGRRHESAEDVGERFRRFLAGSARGAFERWFDRSIW